MRAPSFWWRERSVAAAALAPLARIYDALATRRLARPGESIGTPVLCIGNPTVGGAGKTPTAIAVARLLSAADERPVFLTRGYGGRLAGPVVVDARVHRARDVGEEPLLLAQTAPTVAARDRLAGARVAQAAGASVIVMDDGFQNPALAKDLSVLVINARRGIGNGRVLPAGPLRAALGPQLERAQALLVIGGEAGAPAVAEAAQARGLALFHGRLVPDATAVAALKGRQVLAFAGIGDPDKFFATLAEAGIDAPACRGFPDHHRYGAIDAATLMAQADRYGLTLVTTEKDLLRFRGDRAVGPLSARARALPVALAVEEADRFRRFVLDGVSKPRFTIGA